MNIYEKLQTARCELQDLKIKKSGKNAFAKYEYYELSDFLPTINNLMLKNGLCSQVSFLDETAILRIIDSEKPEDSIDFHSPMSTADLKGCHAVQNLGAVETYQRRYLYMLAFEIVEQDVLDQQTGAEKPKPRATTPQPQVYFDIKKWWEGIKALGIGEEQVKKTYGVMYDLDKLTKEQAVKIYNELKNEHKKTEEQNV